MDSVKKCVSIEIPVFYSGVDVFLSPMFEHPFTEYDDTKKQNKLIVLYSTDNKDIENLSIYIF